MTGARPDPRQCLPRSSPHLRGVQELGPLGARRREGGAEPDHAGTGGRRGAAGPVRAHGFLLVAPGHQGRAGQPQAGRAPHDDACRTSTSATPGDLRFTVRLHRDRVPRRRAFASRRAVPRGLQGPDVQRRAGREAVTSLGASRQTMDVAKEGIVGRGVLIDIPRLRGTAWVEPGDFVYARRDRGGRAGAGHPAAAGRHPVLPHRTRPQAAGRGALGGGQREGGVPHATAMPLFHERRRRGDRLRRRRRDGAEPAARG